MNKSNSPDNDPREHVKEDSVSRRVADELHGRIDQAADKTEKFERTLHERGAQAQEKAREMGSEAQEKAQQLNSSFTRLARDNPWAVMGGAVALGFLIGAITGRR